MSSSRDDNDERRSHRWLGEQLDLFHLPQYSPGIACRHPRGLRVYHALEELIRELDARYGYGEVAAR